MQRSSFIFLLLHFIKLTRTTLQMIFDNWYTKNYLLKYVVKFIQAEYT